MRLLLLLLVTWLVALAGDDAEASPLFRIDGLSGGVADRAGGPAGVGTHGHNPIIGGRYLVGQPAEVGRHGNQDSRGIAEFDVSPLTAVAEDILVTLTFSVFAERGVELNTHATYAFNGTIKIVAFVGNGQLDLDNFGDPGVDDFNVLAFAEIGVFDTTDLVVRDVLVFPVTSVVEEIVTRGEHWLGIRLASDPLIPDGQLSNPPLGFRGPPGGAWSFNDFRLIVDAASPTAVPLPAALPLLAVAMGVLGAAAWHSRRTGPCSSMRR